MRVELSQWCEILNTAIRELQSSIRLPVATNIACQPSSISILEQVAMNILEVTSAKGIEKELAHVVIISVPMR